MAVEVTSVASLVRKPRSKFWFACFRDANGKQRRKSTKTTDHKKAMNIAEQCEQVGQRKLPGKTVRETLADLYREIYNESLPSATVRRFIENWLNTKQPEVSPATLAFYRKSTAKLLEFLGPSADLDLASVTRTTLVEFRNQVAQKRRQRQQTTTSRRSRRYSGRRNAMGTSPKIRANSSTPFAKAPQTTGVLSRSQKFRG
jgi:hypothetical protein